MLQEDLQNIRTRLELLLAIAILRRQEGSILDPDFDIDAHAEESYRYLLELVEANITE